jgi:hypothetical protein
VPDSEECTHQGRPLLWHHYDPEEGVEWFWCQDCGRLVAMEPPDPEDV